MDSFASLYVDDVHASQKTHLWVTKDCYGDSFASLYVDDVHASQKTHLWVTKDCYGDSFASLYVDDVHVSQKTHLWVTKDCYSDSFASLYVDDVHASQKTHLWVTKDCYGDVFTFLLYMMFVPRRKHTYVLPRPVTGLAFPFFDLKKNAEYFRRGSQFLAAAGRMTSPVQSSLAQSSPPLTHCDQ
jgi:hypothetical protein